MMMLKMSANKVKVKKDQQHWHSMTLVGLLGVFIWRSCRSTEYEVKIQHKSDFHHGYCSLFLSTITIIAFVCLVTKGDDNTLKAGNSD